MKIFTDSATFLEFTKSLKGSIGFVPTMGALHEGHMSLISKAKAENDYCVISIFVNPTQFLPSEDLSKYPRRDEADKKLCQLMGVDAIFMPTIETIYGSDEPKIVASSIAGYIFEGERRPGHFDGVLSVVLKLLNLSSASRVYFGQKDAQQLLLIKKMKEAFFLPVEIVDCPTVREKDGLAMSSRNIYLNTEERREALKISKSLFVAGAMIGRGSVDCDKILESMMAELDGVEVEYIAFCDRRLCHIESIKLGESIILIACKIGTTRLIDNLWV